MFAGPVRKNLVAIARAYGEAEGVPLSTVSKRAYGNGSFLGQYAKGHGAISVEKVESMLAWFRANWPENADWPFLPAIFMDRRPQKNKG